MYTFEHRGHRCARMRPFSNPRRTLFCALPAVIVYSSRTGVWHTIMGRSLLRSSEVTLAEMLAADGVDVVHNLSGANPSIPLGPLSYQLRSGHAHSISNAGVGRAVLELGRQQLVAE